MTDREALTKALAILAAILEMSDHVEKMGGLTSISGVAAAHKLQTSIQRNRKRLVDLAKNLEDHAKGDAA